MSAKTFSRNMIKLGYVTAESDDSGNLPIQQASYMDKSADFLVVMPYGMHANLPVDTLLTVFNCNGDEGNLHAIPHVPSERIKDLKTNEVIFFNPKTKSFIHFKENGDIDIESTSDINVEAVGDINVTCVNLNLNCNIKAVGDTDFTGSVTANGKTIDDTHTHSGSPTAPNGPVSNTGDVI